jgi:hypothetical protein
MDKITTHIADAKARLLEQYKGAPNFEALWDIFVQQVQEIEDAIYDVIGLLDVETMEGDQLDLLGRVLGRTRQEMDDETYRVFLKSQIGINTSRGTTEQLLAVFKILTAGSTCTISEDYPAAVELVIDGALRAVIKNNIQAILQDVVGAGVWVKGITLTVGDPFILGWSTEADPTTEGKGLSWTGTLDQGQLTWTL